MLGKKAAFVNWKGLGDFVDDMIIRDSTKGDIGEEGHLGLEGLTDWTYQRVYLDLAELGRSDCRDPAVARMANYLSEPWAMRRRGHPGPRSWPKRPANG
jgi:hypothetical protein